jgi:tRNA pseudouridine55 synthase
MQSNNNLDGVLIVDKAPGMTSHDVVAIVRRALNTKKVGHCGTLDPLATGLLIIVIGRGTKIQDLLMSEDKEYVGTLKLGETTDSQDADGQLVETRPVPELSRERIDQAFAKFDGDFYQMPPMVSAIKMEGVPLYKLARQGKTVEREPRFVHIFAHEIKKVELPEIEFRVVCSKGFYVRTYAFDIGNDLGCGAHLKALRRTKSGKFTLDCAVTVEDLKTKPAAEIASKILSLPTVSRMRGA